MYSTYIIYSVKSDIYYKGVSDDISRRLWEHNYDKSRYTAGKGPWELSYTHKWETKKEALVEELRLKKLNRKSLELLIAKYKAEVG